MEACRVSMHATARAFRERRCGPSLGREAGEIIGKYGRVVCGSWRAHEGAHSTAGQRRWSGSGRWSGRRRGRRGIDTYICSVHIRYRINRLRTVWSSPWMCTIARPRALAPSTYVHVPALKRPSPCVGFLCTHRTLLLCQARRETSAGHISRTPRAISARGGPPSRTPRETGQQGRHRGLVCAGTSGTRAPRLDKGWCIEGDSGRSD